jgi:ParB/RepB/Spo0J family partition protein
MSKLLEVPISAVVENEVALRAVKKETEEYKGLVDSIRTRGFIGAISVREVKTPDGKVAYEVIDGLHRFNAARDAGLQTIKVDVQNLGQEEILEAQIMMNIHKVETKPVEYSKQLIRLLSLNPLLTEAGLATKLGKSGSWVKERLNLAAGIKNEAIVKLVDEGKISLANAYALAKLPEDVQPEFVDRAMTLAPAEFCPLAAERNKAIKEDRRKGKTGEEVKFSPVAFMQSLKDVKAEAESGKLGKALVAELKIADPSVAFQMGVKWCLHLDPKSVDAQKAKFDEMQKQAEENKKRRMAERAAEKAKKTEEEAAKAKKAAAEAAAILGKK